MRDQVLITTERRQGQADVRRLLLVLDNGLYVATVGLFVLFALAVPFFLTLENAMNILTAASLKGIVVVGVTIAIIGGLIDTSVLGVVAVGSVLTGVFFQQLGLPWPLTLLLVLLAGVLMGLFNGVIVVNGKITAFIATLATGAVFLGIAVGLTNGQLIVITRPELQDALLVNPLGVPLAVWIMAGCYVLAYIMLNHTRLGAHLYAVGANYTAARLSGVPVDRTIRIGFVLTALIAVLAAVLATVRGGGTLLYGITIGTFDLTEIFVAVLLGGASLFGGVGKIERNLVAVIFLSILGNGLQLLGTPTSVWLMVKGVALVAAVIIDVVRQRLQ